MERELRDYPMQQGFHLTAQLFALYSGHHACTKIKKGPAPSPVSPVEAPHSGS